jgi:hypothetical protein
MLDRRHPTATTVAISACIAATMITLSVAPVASAQTVVQSWLDRYDGTDHRTDRGLAIVIDDRGNTIVGGFSSETPGGSYLAIKYAPDGTRTWIGTATTASGGIGRTMTVDDAGNVIVVGSASAGALFGMVKYSAAGIPLWSTTYDPGPGFLTSFAGVATDSTGAIYAYGNHWPSTSSPWSIVLVKYAADGSFLWNLVYSTPSSRAEAIVVTDDAVYLGGNSEVANNDEDLLVLKVTPSGTVAWARTYGRTGSFALDGATDMAIDSSGNIVAAGTYSGNSFPTLTTDIAVVRIAPDGTTLSEVLYDGPDGLHDDAQALVLDAADNAIVTGEIDGPGGGYDVLTVKLSPAGNEIWTVIYAGLETFIDAPNDMAIDDLGDIYIVGDRVSDGLIVEYFTIKYDAAGMLQWELLYGGAPHDQSHGMAIAVGLDRRVSVTGYSNGGSSQDDAATLSYTQTEAPVVPTCGFGGVNSGCGATVDVLLVNGMAGGTARTLSLGQTDPVTITLAEAPANIGDMRDSQACIYAWTTSPTASDVVTLPLGLGPMCYGPPVLATRLPVATWNSIGRINKLGADDAPGPPPLIPDGGSFTLLTLPGGVGFPITLTLQGIIEDSCSQGMVPFSVTNGMVLQVVP